MSIYLLKTYASPLQKNIYGSRNRLKARELNTLRDMCNYIAFWLKLNFKNVLPEPPN